MNEIIIRTIRNQTVILFENIRETLDYCSDELIEKSSSKWPLWKQFYHLLHSLDQWFINPMNFTEPAIHQPHFRTSDQGPGILSKQQLLTYYHDIRRRIENYLDTLTVEILEEPVGKGEFNRLDLILIQFRHVMHHIGYLHHDIKSETGISPEYIGIKAQW